MTHMKNVILDVRSQRAAAADFVRVWNSGKAEKTARISLATPELLWQVLSAKRWSLLKALCGAGPVSIRDASRRVRRDVRAVRADVTVLLNAGILTKVSVGIVCPFDAIKVEFFLTNREGIAAQKASRLRRAKGMKTMADATERLGLYAAEDAELRAALKGKRD
jgi:predicted transcriptional regulator